MFTGIVQAQGKLLARDVLDGGAELWRVETPFEDLALGESVALDGVCLTVTGSAGPGPTTFVLSPETLDVTALGDHAVGAMLNLERALRASDRMSGHWVQGHVDGVAVLSKREVVGECLRLVFEIPEALRAFCVSKGSITLAGVSLTIVEVRSASEARFAGVAHSDSGEIELMIIPYTAEVTGFGALAVGERVNVEVDMMAKLVRAMVTDLKREGSLALA